MIAHITTQQAWQSALAAGEYRAASLDSEGFIHCSKPEQVLAVANTFYRQVPDQVLLWIDPARLQARLAWEAPAEPGHGAGERFPHVYGGINLDAVLSVVEFLPDADGVFRRLPSPRM